MCAASVNAIHVLWSESCLYIPRLLSASCSATTLLEWLIRSAATGTCSHTQRCAAPAGYTAPSWGAPGRNRKVLCGEAFGKRQAQLLSCLQLCVQWAPAGPERCTIRVKDPAAAPGAALHMGILRGASHPAHLLHTPPAALPYSSSVPWGLTQPLPACSSGRPVGAPWPAGSPFCPQWWTADC